MKCINCKKEINEEDNYVEMDISQAFDKLINNYGEDTIYLCDDCSNNKSIREKVQFDFLTGRTFNYYVEEE